jgi:hypothetical protein
MVDIVAKVYNVNKVMNVKDDYNIDKTGNLPAKSA